MSLGPSVTIEVVFPVLGERYVAAAKEAESEQENTSSMSKPTTDLSNARVSQKHPKKYLAPYSAALTW